MHEPYMSHSLVRTSPFYTSPFCRIPGGISHWAAKHLILCNNTSWGMLRCATITSKRAQASNNVQQTPNGLRISQAITGVKKASPWETPKRKSEKGFQGSKKARKNVEYDYFSSFLGVFGSFSTRFRLSFEHIDPGPRGPGNPFSDFFLEFSSERPS